MEYEFRPITSWPGELRRPGQRKQSPFRSRYSTTLERLEAELRHLDAKRIVIELAIESPELRVDGMLRSHAKPAHPGVVLSFDSKHGPLRYFTDRYDNLYARGFNDGWKANLHAITLGLESLRAVDRYGITHRAEQYTGWSALPPGTIAAGPASMTIDEALAFLTEAAGWEIPPDIGDPFVINIAYRTAAKLLHPDNGGDPEMFKRLADAKRVLDGKP